jgi:hypothetical protein
MANNRIHLTCVICKQRKVEKCSILIAKYYPPPTGWSRWNENLSKDLDAFLVAHAHEDEDLSWDTRQWGYHIIPVREINE